MSWRQEVHGIPGLECRWDADLTNLSTFRMASRGDWIGVASEAALAALLRLLNTHQVGYRVLGWGANQVLRPRETDVFLHLDFPVPAEALAHARDEYELPASLGLNLLTSHAVQFGLKGWENLTGIPASLGGALYMNAGTSLGEIAAITRRVRVMGRDGTIRTVEITPESFSYRHNHFVAPGEVIVGATLIHHGLEPALGEKIKGYLETRRRTQPLATRNCGCVFKNASPSRQAGRLIDLTGLKGLSVGALRISPRHANFMENAGGATWEDFQRLTNVINQQMLLHWGVSFELEVKAL
jgi:UDP-N-acetylmuramate dehydrogenase